MQELVAKVGEVVLAHPGTTAAAAIAVLVMLLVWAVVATSYRYR